MNFISVISDFFSKPKVLPHPASVPAPAGSPTPFAIADLCALILGHVGQPRTTGLVCKAWNRARPQVLTYLLQHYVRYPSLNWLAGCYGGLASDIRAAYVVRDILREAKDFGIALPHCKADPFELTVLIPLVQKIDFYLHALNLANLTGTLRNTLPPIQDDTVDFFDKSFSPKTRIEKCTEWLTAQRDRIKRLNLLVIGGMTVIPKEIILLENLQRIVFSEGRLQALNPQLQKLKRLVQIDFEKTMRFNCQEAVKICKEIPTLAQVTIHSKDLELQEAFKAELPDVKIILLVEEEPTVNSAPPGSHSSGVDPSGGLLPQDAPLTVSRPRSSLPVTLVEEKPKDKERPS